MMMDTRIPMMGQTPDIIGSVARGQTAGAQGLEYQNQNALRRFLQEQGPGVMAGDGNALSGLSRLDLGSAMAARGANQEFQFSGERMQIARETARRQGAAFAAQMSAAERATQAEQLERALSMGTQAQTPEQWDAIMQQVGAADLVGQFDQRQIYIAGALGLRDALALNAGPAEPEPTAEMRNLQFRAEAAGLQPGTPEFQQFMATGGRAGPDTVINLGGGGDAAFGERVATRDAEIFGEIEQAGRAAGRSLNQLTQLEGLLSDVPTGMQANWQLIAGRLGIPTEGLDNLQAAQALINQLVPAQRPPGSGPMSDADLALFIESLPRIINQPGGNQTIMRTMRAILEYDQQAARIATRVLTGEIPRADGRLELSRLADPLAGVRSGGGAAAPQPQPAPAQGEIPAPDQIAVMPVDQIRTITPAMVRQMTMEQLEAYVSRTEALEAGR